IMAGGEGTRLRPVTCGIPKPMVPVLNKPVMEYIIELLKKHGITDIAATLAYFPAVITDYFGDGGDFGVSLRYYVEHTPLGTGGSVKNAEDFLEGTFVIVSGDALTDIDLGKALEFHKSKGSKATLVLKRVPIPLEYGVVITDEEGRITSFLEKPSWGEVFSDTINTGIYILEPDILHYYKKGDNFDFSKDLFPRLLNDGIPMYGHVTRDYWNDIGDLRVYKEVNYDILNGKVRTEIEYREIEKGIWAGNNTEIDESCVLNAPVLIGSNCRIKGNTLLEAAIIGNNCEIAGGTSIKRSIIWKNSKVGRNVQSRGAVICSGATVKEGVHLFENSVIGSNTTLETGAIIKPDIKIWPEKDIEADAIVTQNLVWGTKASKTLFGYRDINGDVNVNITPEFASRLGSAFGSTIRESSRIIVSSDGSNASEIIRDAFIAGVLSTGVGVISIENAVMPIMRFAVRFYKAEGGVHIWKDYNAENKVHLEFSNSEGINIDRPVEKKIENSFTREDFKRCNADSIKDIVRVENFAGYYIQTGTNMLKDYKKIKAAGLRLVVGSRSRQVVDLAASYLRNLGCSVETVVFETERTQGAEAGKFHGDSSRIAELTVRYGACMGVVLKEDGESAVLIDHKGRILDKDKQLALTSLIILKSGMEKRLIVPHTASRVIEKMAECYSIEVVRTKNTPAALMKEMFDKKLNMEESLFQYILNFDGIWGVGSLLDFMAANSAILYDLVNELPHFHMERNEVQCDWRHKGRVIREIIEENKSREIELFEGVRINSENGWVLILPDSERPVCNIYAEGSSEEYARELAAEFTERIKSIVALNDGNED
ncbi:MAG TPA: sugar phosphate nucleotidyltransferase, partial [Clostridia bacterium]|nr:sugar phosphate nucleotidyltransferase [Clostridia bacterium]